MSDKPTAGDVDRKLHQFDECGCMDCLCCKDAAAPVRSLRCDLETMQRQYEITDSRLRKVQAERDELAKVVEAAVKLWTSLVPFTGTITSFPIPGIKTKVRVRGDCFYTIAHFRDALFATFGHETTEPCPDCQPQAEPGPGVAEVMRLEREISASEVRQALGDECPRCHYPQPQAEAGREKKP